MSDSEGREQGILANVFRRRATRPPAGEEGDSNLGFCGRQGTEHNSDQQPFVSPSIPEPNRIAAATRLPSGMLLYLVVTGFVATATIGVFFGTGLPLLLQRSEETIAGSRAHDHRPEIQTPPQSENPIAKPELVVAQWGFGHSLETARKQALQGNGDLGRPIYLWMTLNGTQAVVDRMRAGPRPTIQVRWIREDGNATASVVELTIGGPSVADALERQVQRRGFFEWYSWIRKKALGTGRWAVALTYPNGQPLLCGQDAQPCRFTIFLS
jgi:hypothetical protein